jgi:hypothetical protein
VPWFPGPLSSHPRRAQGKWDAAAAVRLECSVEVFSVFWRRVGPKGRTGDSCVAVSLGHREFMTGSGLECLSKRPLVVLMDLKLHRESRPKLLSFHFLGQGFPAKDWPCEARAYETVVERAHLDAFA